VFHQFGQCGWAHALSYDGAHWKNARYPVAPDLDPKHFYDSCGAYDGSLTLADGVNDGAKTSFLRHSLLKLQPSIYQDRLGTNM
jgi:sucrose-6-phosphate hydrolase SacC (GH32 family)